jgi:TonB family protein
MTFTLHRRMSVKMSRLPLLTALLWLCAATAIAQTGKPPVLTRQPYAPYPEAARKAHVSGEAIVSFSIDPAGKPIKVKVVSGPVLLTGGLQDEIRSWNFVTPLPSDSEKDFLAEYTYSLIEPAKPTAATGNKPKPNPDEDHEEDDEPEPIAAVAGVVHSVNNRQYIDATPLIKSQKYSAPATTTLPN